MQLAEYEKGLLVAASWQLAKSADVNELLAIACTIRNWVVSRFQSPGQPVAVPMRDHVYYPSYSEAIEDFLSIYGTRSLPKPNEPSLIDPDEGLMGKIDAVYDCTLPDVTSSRNTPAGARYFNRGNAEGSWVYSHIVQFPDKHPLIGTFGSQQFYA